MTTYYFMTDQGIDFDFTQIKVKLLSKLSDLPQSIQNYESKGYHVVGIKLDTASPVAELLYDPTLSTPDPDSLIHRGIEGTETVDEEIPRLHESTNEMEIKRSPIIEESFDSNETDELRGASIYGGAFSSSIINGNGKIIRLF